MGLVEQAACCRRGHQQNSLRRSDEAVEGLISPNETA